MADVDGDSLLDVVSASVSNEVVKWYKAAHAVGDDVDDPSTDVSWTTYTIDAAYHDRFDDDGGASPIEVQAVKVVVADLDGDDKLDVLYADDKTASSGGVRNQRMSRRPRTGALASRSTTKALRRPVRRNGSWPPILMAMTMSTWSRRRLPARSFCTRTWGLLP